MVSFKFLNMSNCPLQMSHLPVLESSVDQLYREELPHRQVLRHRPELRLQRHLQRRRLLRNGILLQVQSTRLLQADLRRGRVRRPGRLPLQRSLRRVLRRRHGMRQELTQFRRQMMNPSSVVHNTKVIAMLRNFPPGNT